MTTSAPPTSDLWQAIKNGRGEQLDWLSENAPIDTIATTLTAMANNQGGTLVIGVLGPTGTVVGVKDADNAIDRVLQAALSLEPPLIMPLPRASHLKDRPVVVISVPAGMPHVYALDGRYWYREGVENTPLKPRDLRRLLFERGDVSFETEIAAGATLDDIDWAKVRQYASTINAAFEPDMLLLKRGCVANVDDTLKPTHAGILLFGKDPQTFNRGAIITAVRFAGTTMGDRFTRVDITGTLPDQIRRAETFLIDHMRKDVTLGKSMERAEQFEYPLEAARELVVNAVAHRDYSIAGDEIRLFIFSDHMEVSSPGGLPGPVTVSNIKSERFSRNPAIVQVLSDMRFIERLGYGVDRIYDLLDEKELPPPHFEETAGGFRVTLFSRPESTGAMQIHPSVQFDGTYQGVAINPRQEAALIHLHSGSTRITNSDLQELCPDVHAETIRRDLVDLVNKHILKKLGSKRGSYYVLNPDFKA